MRTALGGSGLSFLFCFGGAFDLIEDEIVLRLAYPG